MTLADEFARSLSELLPEPIPSKLAVAVSGGSDSTALLYLMADWAAGTGAEICAVTVDHGLREAAASEADDVARKCVDLNIPHQTLRWTGWQGRGNLQDQARQARYRLIGDWAVQNQIYHVALGHTLDDQAETFLMRLARGSGVDGLSAIPAQRRSGGIDWVRPVLGQSRADLREYLNDHGIGWVDDPSNEDPKYDRIKMRTGLDALQALGISRRRLSDTALRLGSARQVLEQTAYDVARSSVTLNAGNVEYDIKQLFAAAPETRRRLLGHALKWVSGAGYGPRQSALGALEQQIRAKTTITLHGCLISVVGRNCRIGREPAALASETCPTDQIWDGRWRVDGPHAGGIEVRLTGANGLKLCNKWRETGLDRNTLIAAPAVWRGEEMIAAPLAGMANGWQAELIHNENDFFTTILSH